MSKVLRRRDTPRPTSTTRASGTVRGADGVTVEDPATGVYVSCVEVEGGVALTRYTRSPRTQNYIVTHAKRDAGVYEVAGTLMRDHPRAHVTLTLRGTRHVLQEGELSPHEPSAPLVVTRPT